MPKYSKTEVQESMDRLQELLKPGDTIYCILRSVSRSGMSRVISLYFISDGVPHYLDYSAAVVLGYARPDQGIKVGGAGMDMGFHLVYSLSRALFRDSGFVCIGENCPANDQLNGDRDYTPHKHSNPGYALKYRWL